MLGEWDIEGRYVVSENKVDCRRAAIQSMWQGNAADYSEVKRQ
jgi:hypothetical protein